MTFSLIKVTLHHLHPLHTYERLAEWRSESKQGLKISLSQSFKCSFVEVGPHVLQPGSYLAVQSPFLPIFYVIGY